MATTGADDGRQLIVRSRRDGPTWGEVKNAWLLEAAERRKQAKADKGKKGDKAKSGSQSARGAPSKGAGAKRNGSAPGSARTPGSQGKPGAAAGSNRPQSAAKPEKKPKDPARLTNMLELLERMTEAKYTVDFCEKPFFRTALWEATWKNHDDIAKLLLDRKACVDKADYQGRTPLHEAAYYGHLEIVDLLMDRGHPVDPKDKFGDTPLFRAVEAGRHDVVLRLVDRKADIGAMDDRSLGLQHSAAFFGDPHMSKWLFYHGAFHNHFAMYSDSERGRRASGATATAGNSDRSRRRQSIGLGLAERRAGDVAEETDAVAPRLPPLQAWSEVSTATSPHAMSTGTPDPIFAKQ